VIELRRTDSFLMHSSHHQMVYFIQLIYSISFPPSSLRFPCFSPFDSTEPWFHVTYFFVGGWIGQQWVQLERELLLDINEIRADKGMPPMVATNAMLGLKYQKSE